MLALAGARLRRRAVRRQPVLAVGDPDSVPDLLARGARPQHPDRLRRPAVARAPRRSWRSARSRRTTSCCAFPACRSCWRSSAAALIAALVGILFGLPSLRIRGFYLAVATLAAQFFILWCLTKVGWFTNYSSSGVITAQQIVILGYAFDTPAAKYLLVLSIVTVMALAAKNMVRGNVGPLVDGGARHGRRGRGDRHPPDARPSCSRSRSARSTAASRARCSRTRTSARSSRRRSASTCRSGSCSWSSSAASARSWARSSAPRSSSLLPMLLSVTVAVPRHQPRHLRIPESAISNLELMVFGGLIIFFLIVEPHGLARLWQIAQGEAAAVAVSALTARRGSDARRMAPGRARMRWSALVQLAEQRSYRISICQEEQHEVQSRRCCWAPRCSRRRRRARRTSSSCRCCRTGSGRTRPAAPAIYGGAIDYFNAGQHDRRHQRRQARRGRSARPSTTRRAASSATSA